MGTNKIKAVFFDYDGVLTLDKSGSMTTCNYLSKGKNWLLLMSGKRLFALILFVVIIVTSCENNSNEVSYDEVNKSLVYAEKTINELGYVTAISGHKNDYVKFRIMIKDRINNNEARALAEKFISSMESQISNKSSFRKLYSLTFDFKSENDGVIFYIGKRDKGSDEIWWQWTHNFD